VTPARAATLAAAMALGVVAACTSEQASPGPAPTTAPPPTTASPTTAPPTSTTTTTAPATTTTSTTTTSLPTGPVDAVVPLFVGGESDGWLFMGTWQVDTWRGGSGDGSPVAPILEEPTLRVTGLWIAETTGQVGPNVEACFDGRVGPTIDVAVDPPQPPGYGYSAVALNGDWTLKPRPVVDVRRSVPAYQALAAATFEGQPVDPSLARVEQIVIADLDADGDDEAIVAFEYVQDPDAPGTPGDLAALLLVDTATRDRREISSNIVPPDDGDETTFDIIERFRVLDIVDLNGDGRMEVVVHAWYYEGASVTVYEYDGRSLNAVLGTGCGA
jgi:hypothetical protein